MNIISNCPHREQELGCFGDPLVQALQVFRMFGSIVPPGDQNRLFKNKKCIYLYFLKIIYLMDYSIIELKVSSKFEETTGIWTKT